MKSIIDDIIEGNAITKQTGNALTQDVSQAQNSIPLCPTVVTDLCQELYDKIDFEVNGAPRFLTAPTIRGSNERVYDPR